MARDILIVEDTASERDRLKTSLSQGGFIVDTSSTISKAKELLKDNCYRLIILDIGLEDGSGTILFDEIKDSNNIEHILIFTGNPSEHLKQQFLDQGAVDYIIKGSFEAQTEQLTQTIVQILGNKSEVIREIPLEEFINLYIDKNSKELFLEGDGNIPMCQCGSQFFVVSFHNRVQNPPEIIGEVVCGKCRKLLDLKLG